MLTVLEEMREFRGFSEKMNENSSKRRFEEFSSKPGHPFKAYSFCCYESFLGFCGVCLTCAKFCAIVCAL